MSTYVYMRFLESAPRRYDLGIRLLSRGRVADLYRDVAAAAVAGDSAPRVLEIGCGTGNLTQALAALGARVTAVDWNPDMLAVAAEKLSGVRDRVDLREMAAVEIADRFPAGSFDSVASTLTFSEMGEDEQLYTLRAAHAVLRNGGRLAIGDEVRPRSGRDRWLHAALRWPAAIVTYVLTQSTTTAIGNLAGLVSRAGFRVLAETRSAHGSIAIVVAEKTPAPTPEGPQGEP